MHPHLSLCTLDYPRVLRDGRAFTIKKPLGTQGSACVEVMTTLHGSTRLFGGAEGCIARGLDPIKISFLHVGASVDLQSCLGHDWIWLSLPYVSIFVGEFTVTSLDSPSWIRVGGRLTTIRSPNPMASIQEAIASLGQRIDGQQAQQVPVQEDTQFDTIVPLPPPHSHHTTTIPLLAYFYTLAFNTVIDVSRRELEALRQRPEESVTSFISRWREKISQIIDRPSERDQISMIMRSLQPRFARHLMGFPHTDFGSLVQALYGIEEGIARGLWSDPRRTEIRRCWCYQFSRDEAS
ncbi:hypothetical protein AAG906_015601 [Vitis piasezkii]